MLNAAFRNRWAVYRVEAILAIAGLICLTNAGAGWWRFRYFQARYSVAFADAPETRPASAAKPLLRANAGEPIGRLSIPRLGLSTVVVEGDNDSSLQVGAGHATTSAPLGAEGNVVIAGHRDTAFWPLRKVRVGDRIQVTAGGRHTYIVRGLSIVSATDVSLLQPVHDAVLTLVTCYPFRHVGPAPKRFIVRASLAGQS